MTILTNNYADSMVLAKELQELVKQVNDHIIADDYDHWNTHIRKAKQAFQKFYSKRYKNHRRLISKFYDYHNDMKERMWSELIEFDPKEFGDTIFKGEW